ncbi:MAG: hypothetical protein P3T54_02175 [Dehalogenimonas sp.]|jgi:hypothetical protein|uniref:Cytochrome b561 domain-containing protein n=1 Tax=Candidatus Dehalogenimonas loeffleri TaxID=3127115 RepID=A0ABZ2J559_9CHLR|nr:hypothetical protein [Dehalogenimonas sp.]
MSLSVWSAIFVVFAGVCAFTLKAPGNPLKGFITPKLFFVHILLGLTAIVLAIAAAL